MLGKNLGFYVNEVLFVINLICCMGTANQSETGGAWMDISRGAHRGAELALRGLGRACKGAWRGCMGCRGCTEEQ